MPSYRCEQWRATPQDTIFSLIDTISIRVASCVCRRENDEIRDVIKSLSFHTTPTGKRFNSPTDLTCIAALHDGSLVVLGSNS
ncbi:hypothetical protein TNCV_2347311 [Trichonephila clavipes]|nr:hypothetical protein TNCV_2347311 [Trichonephila clavipes]